MESTGDIRRGDEGDDLLIHPKGVASEALAKVAV